MFPYGTEQQTPANQSNSESLWKLSFLKPFVKQLHSSTCSSSSNRQALEGVEDTSAGHLPLKVPLFRLLVMPVMFQEMIFSKMVPPNVFSHTDSWFSGAKVKKGGRTVVWTNGWLWLLGSWWFVIPSLAQFILLCLSCTYSSIVIRVAPRHSVHQSQRKGLSCSSSIFEVFKSALPLEGCWSTGAVSYSVPLSS